MSGFIEEAFRHWERIRGGEAVPRRARLDPVDIPNLLSRTILVDVLSDPLDFRYRLVGTWMRSLGDRDLTGLRFSEIPRIARGGRLWSDHEAVVRTLAPVVNVVDYEGGGDGVGSLWHALFPLTTDGRGVDKIWCVGEAVSSRHRDFAGMRFSRKAG